MTEPPRPVLFEDVPYAARDGEILLARIYRVADAGAATAVVDVHPGAWSEGDRTWGRVYGEALARRGFVVVALDFRQGPRFAHPAASADVATGVRWVRAASEPLGIDPGRIALTGSSSGGHLAMLAACRPNAPEHAGAPLRWDRSGEVPGEIDASVRCVAALWPPVDPGARYEWLLERLRTEPPDQHDHYRSLLDGTNSYFGDRGVMRAVSVPRIVRDGEATHLPPVWVCYPELDQNVPSFIVEDLEAAWRAAGGTISVSVYEGAEHAFGHWPGAATDRFVDELAAFLRRFTEPGEANTSSRTSDVRSSFRSEGR
ncbi:MAG TPA: alpha/beta hydrolase [Actinomycetota bacterium]|nr:alpha/beta hydrolase [Actinomycetota bacterium]